MNITSLSIQNLRLFDEINIEPHKNINLIYGENASGKTTILEAIYLLVRNRSFRKTTTKYLIKHDESFLNISAQINDDDGFKNFVRLNKTKNSTLLTLNTHPQKQLSPVAYKFPIGLVRPNIQKIVEDLPNYRRRFIDWLMFHVEQDYVINLNNYKHVLNQRNQSLRNNPSLVYLWNDHLITLNNTITKQRIEHLNNLQVILEKLFVKLFPRYQIDISFYAGWNKEFQFSELLDRSLKIDKERGYTRYGQHRADLIITLDKVPIKHILSRGELKIVATLLILASLLYVKQIQGIVPILLCDDFDSEIDRSYLNQLVEIIVDTHFQTFITTLDKHSYSFDGSMISMFHVKHS